MKRKIIYILSTLLLTTLLISCQDEWFEKKPKGQALEESFYNEKGVQLLLIGAYSAIDGTTGIAGSWASAVSNWVWGGVASDDAYKGSTYGDQSTINYIEAFQATSTNGYVNYKWKGMYNGIARCNDVLRTMKQIKDLYGDSFINDETALQIEAQAKFLRGHFYFELTKMFQKVPFINEDTEKPDEVPNDKVLYPEIESDLKFAVDNLPKQWSGQPGRVTSWAAKSYLAYVYMFQKKWDDAEKLLDDVYANGPFELMESYEQNYLAEFNNNKESIFEIQYSVNDGVSGSYNAGWGDALNFPYAAEIGVCCGFYQPTQNLVNAHKTDENGLPLLDTYNDSDIPWDPDLTDDEVVPEYDKNVDIRLDHTVGRPGKPYLDWGIHQGNSWIRDAANGGPYIYKKNMFLKKDKGIRSTTTGWATGVNDNNFRKIRLAHVILWRAEVKVELGDLAEATKMVNLIRERAKNSNVVKFDDGTPVAKYKVEPYPTFTDKEYALKAVRMETRLEFSMEGMRFFDLVRWGIAGKVMNAYLKKEGNLRSYLKGKSFTEGQNEYWLIPQDQIDLSTDLKQVN